MERTREGAHEFFPAFKEILNPFGGKALGFKIPSDGMPEDVGIKVHSSGMKIFNVRGLAYFFYDVADQADGDSLALV